MATPTFTKSGAKATTAAKLDKTVFALDVKNHDLLKQAYLAYQANGRENLAVTKTRGLVSGGGRKPWKQKGTGRARFGSSRNPIWRGGGIVFGPTGQENYSQSINTKAKRLALRQALSLAAANNRIIVLETFDCKDGKTAVAAKLLEKIGANGKVLLAVSQKNDLVERATRNLSGVKATHASYLNVFDVLNADFIVITEKSLQIVNEWLGGDK
ncbi:50S ribosomal protein L4 [Candidatus Saccharibacteria bacterium]|nr:50S ribosomal protein L4 [Candidatus Saccharibacteria bacterium]